MNKFGLTLMLLLSVCLQAELKELKVDKTLKVLIKTTPRCIFGDLNAMVLDINEFKIKRQPADIVISLESLDGKVLKSSTVLSTKKGYTQFPTEINFDISDIQSQKAMGLFVCLDTTGSKTCQTKKAQDVKKTLARHTVVEKNGVKEYKNSDAAEVKSLPEDKIYFFQPLTFVDGVIHYYEANLPVKNGNATLSKDFKGLSSSKIITETWKKLNLVQSMPLGSEGGSLTMDLPRYNQEKCS